MKFAIAVTLAVALCHVSAAPTLPVDLLNKLRTEGVADVMVILSNEVQPVINRINSLQYANSVAKTNALVADLRTFTQHSQKPILSFLAQNRVGGVQSFWITNRVFVPKASLELIERLQTTFGSEIAEIRLPIIASIDYTVNSRGPKPTADEWGVVKVSAPALWSDGIRGQGVVVSHIDTGVRSTHESLVGSLRESHAWLDPYSATGSPIDENGHGTHTMGTIMGRGGIGVAPNATYITCRGCDTASCTEQALLACGQWTTCPTQPDGSDEDCSKKPALSSNSWGGGSENAWYNDVVSAWRAANIVPIFAIGNSGPFCRTANSPGDQLNLISVGATTLLDAVAQFSSHGPTLVSNRIKPDVSAPGSNVRSAGHLGDAEYATLSGTSMATPHVAGAVALLLSKNPNLTYAQIDTLLKENNARPRMEQVVCTGGGVNITDPWPNNSFGHGRIDVKLAADAASRL